MLSAHFLKAGASDFIYRPFVPEELQCRIDNNVETLKQLMRLRELAERDHLTGLPNRRSFFDQANALLEAMKKGDGAMDRGSVAIIDIDHFKKINDTLGHSAGDKALKKLAQALSTLCQPGNHIAARIGGEEFALFLKGLNGEQAHAFCEALRLEIERNGQALSSADLALTISIGVVEVGQAGSIDQHLTAADQLLYIAKANGRNIVYSHREAS
jgi:diguanylate cyclase (GGDEF)-like protein